jgi:hypothetical protein
VDRLEEHYGSLACRILEIAELLFSFSAEIRISDAAVRIQNSLPDDAQEVLSDVFTLRSGVAQPRVLLFAERGEARLELLDLAALQL